MEVLEENLPSLTEQLQRFSNGDRAVAESVLREILPELHRIAIRALGRKQDSHFSPTELINEIWLRNMRRGGWQINSRQHFYAIAALAMRQVLIDFARYQSAQRRGGTQATLPLDIDAPMISPEGPNPEAMIQVGILMDQLEARHPEAARIVDLHYFVGFTLEEISEITGLTLRKVRYRWERGRDWLKDGLLRR
jgi:RNA polymerase sigma factor (TIGR02999 family)